MCSENNGIGVAVYQILVCYFIAHEHSLMDCMRVLKDMDIAPQQMLVTGGGGKSALWRQMLCDMFSVPVCSAASSESPALGAAILAAVGAGLYESVEAACAVMVKKGGAILQPVRAHTEIYHTYHNLYKKLYSSLQEDYKTLAQI